VPLVCSSSPLILHETKIAVMNSETARVVHEGQAGFVECENLRFEFHPMSRGAYAIYFPRRKHDRKLARIKTKLEALVAVDPVKWELFEYDSGHKFY
jgi:hypothetical protein